jgi:hypothetical protein
MGTRSLTVFIDESDKEIAVMYRHYDGYPDCHGVELADFLKNKIAANGISTDNDKIFNGMGCLAASVVAHFKNTIGGIYLYGKGSRDLGEKYIYKISFSEINKEPMLEVLDVYDDITIYYGVVSDYSKWLYKEKER